MRLTGRYNACSYSLLTNPLPVALDSTVGLRCRVLSWLAEFKDAVLNCFTLSFFYGCITYTTGRPAQTIVQGHCLFEVRDRETC